MRDGQARMERWRRARSVLDVIATMSVAVAAIAVSVTAVSMYLRHGASVGVSRRADVPPPKEPVSLRGAEVLGGTDATVAIIEYSDFQCPYCADFARKTLPALKDAYIETGKVKFAFRHLPLPSHPHAMRAAQAAGCAGKQGKFWELHDRMFEARGQIDDPGLTALAATLPLDQAAFEACMRTPTADEVSHDVAEAQRLGISGTPTFLIGRVQKDGNVAVARVLLGALPLADFRAAVDTLLEQP